MDLGIVNGKVYIDGSFYEENLYIKNEKVDTITKSYLNCKKEIDAKGMLVLPGFIDPHVHFHLTVGANTSKDDFYSGSVKGALGGITSYIDFLDPIKTGEQLGEAYLKRMDLAKLSVTDYGFHSTIANPTDGAEDIIIASKEKGICSIKLFTTYSETDRRTYDNYIDSLLKVSRELKCRVLVHAENDNMITRSNTILVKDHEKSRPVMSERTEILKLAEIAKERDGLLYIVHVSAGSSVELLARSYKKELDAGNILLESCPHYFLYNSEIYSKNKGYLYTMTPPLREEKERQLLRENLKHVSAIGTDHCPFDVNLKSSSEYTSKIPMGVGGIQYSFPLMYTEFGPSIIPKFTEGPAKAYGLYPRKGTLVPGADADIVLYNESTRSIILDEESIYQGKELIGNVSHVFLRGKQIVDEGAFIGGKGVYLNRELIL